MVPMKTSLIPDWIAPALFTAGSLILACYSAMHNQVTLTICACLWFVGSGCLLLNSTLGEDL